MKTLIINGSPRLNGNTAALTAAFKKELKGDTEELFVYKGKYAPCMDCRVCHVKSECAVKDDMDKIYRDDYDNIVIASPVYMSLLTPPLLSVLSRLQVYYAAKWLRHEPLNIRGKKGVLILTGGGNGSPDKAVETAALFLRILKAELAEDNIVISYDTDKTAAADDMTAMGRIKDIARSLQ
jgi:multimeric flavodoxin WrbA